MNELTTQLEQMKREIAEKEAESRAWEERVAGLSQQLKEERSKFEVVYSSTPCRVLSHTPEFTMYTHYCRTQSCRIKL